jgi:hypothetical protein
MSGLCQCGCGKATRIAPQNHTARGWVKGQPVPFLPGHSIRPIGNSKLDAAPFKIDGVYCRLIPLTKGQFAIVDAADYEWLSQYRWRAFWDWHTKSYYARTYERGKNHETRRELRMHRLIVGLEIGDKRLPDHINHETLDNRRLNLRIATIEQSNQNRRFGRKCG